METKNRILYILLIFLTIIISLSCEPPVKPNNQKDEANLTLTLEDVSCTEAWIKLTTDNLQLPVTISLYRTENTISRRRDFSLSTKDTLIYIDSLLPKQSYKFKAVAMNTTNNKTPTSNELSVLTMDTTSHNFTWQIWTFGEHSSSALYDVAIIDENNIWAVGEIYMRDSLGNIDPNAYNAVHWNGSEWKLKRIPIYLPSGYPFYPVIKSVYGFAANDIWFEAGIHWNGNSFRQIPFNIQWDGHINKLWGRSSNDLYAVGDRGKIAHWDGRKWTKIESGTTLPIMDIYGARDKRTGEYEILCVSADPNIPGYSQVLDIENMIVREMATDPMWEPWGIWFVPGMRYLHAGDGLWEAYRPSGPWVRNFALPSFFKTCIDGQSLNDIVVGGAFWLLAHWNGVSWQTYFPRTSGSFVSVQIKDNLIVAVGGFENKAVIVQGKR